MLFSLGAPLYAQSRYPVLARARVGRQNNLSAGTLNPRAAFALGMALAVAAKAIED